MSIKSQSSCSYCKRTSALFSNSSNNWYIIEFSLLGKIDEEVEVQTVPKLVAVAREHRNSKDCLTAQLKMRLAPGAVLAHCCELELRNGKCLLPAIPIARLIPVKPGIAVDES